jgi:hypothetical protein
LERFADSPNCSKPPSGCALWGSSVRLRAAYKPLGSTAWCALTVLNRRRARRGGQRGGGAVGQGPAHALGEAGMRGGARARAGEKRPPSLAQTMGRSCFCLQAEADATSAFCSCIPNGPTCFLIPTGMHRPTPIFWADRTPSAPQASYRERISLVPAELSMEQWVC